MQKLNLITAVAVAGFSFAGVAQADTLWVCKPVNGNLSKVKSVSIGQVGKSQLLSAKVSMLGTESPRSSTKEFEIEAQDSIHGGASISAEESKELVVFGGNGFALSIDTLGRPVKGGKAARLTISSEEGYESVEMACGKQD